MEKVNVGKIVHISTIDWYGRSVFTIFFNGCNFRCSWCQNYKLLDCKKWVNIEDIKKDILNTKLFISAVVFSGGEPTLQPKALEELAKFVKEQGLLVGIQTNGSFPDVLKDLVNKRLIDKIFLDIKADLLLPMRYGQLTGGAYIVAGRVAECLNIPNVEIEVRTTIFRSINDSLAIAKYLSDNHYNHTYVVQQGVPWNTSDKQLRKDDILSRREILDFTKRFPSLKKVKIRTRERGEEVVQLERKMNKVNKEEREC